MNNPGIDPLTWDRLKKKWSDLQSAGHKLKVEFRLLADLGDEKHILAIDVVQNVDSDVLTETVQKNAGEAHAALGIASLSMEALVAAYKTIMSDLYNQTGQKELDLVVTMTPTSTTSGEVKGYIGKEDSDTKRGVPVNYQHYYLLNALREKLKELTGDDCQRVKAVYRSGELEFYFKW